MVIPICEGTCLNYIISYRLGKDFASTYDYTSLHLRENVKILFILYQLDKNLAETICCLVIKEIA